MGILLWKHINTSCHNIDNKITKHYMIKITFPDNSVREYENGVTGLQIAESISQRLAQDVIACGVNGETTELNRPINEDATIALYKFDDAEGKHAFWHTSAHLMAEAIEELYPGTQFGIGPAIENGFYYDVMPPEGVKLSDADFPKIEKKMQELQQKKEALVRKDISKDEVMALFASKGQTYKNELIAELEDGKITTYTQGNYIDLCKGPHLMSTAPIKAFKLLSLAAAYWRGDEKRPMMTRIYGISFPKASLLEEYNRNTAPAITFAAYSLLRRDPEAVMLATPSDLAIDGQEQFEKALARAFDFASRSDALITLGVVPTRPDPNFGYIQAAEALDEDKAVRVKTFTEKPDPDLAKVFIDTGEFLWNSGMFVWKAQSIKDELEKYAPEITMIWDGWEECLGQDGEAAFLQRVYTSDMPRTSIDYAVMEKTDKAWVYPTHFTWADIGNWDSLYDYLPIHDEDGNASNIVGKVLLKESRNNVLYSGKRGKLTAIRGLENMIVIDTDDVLLICPRDDDKFKPLLSDLALPDYKEFK